MPKAVILVGNIGTGKSKWAQSYHIEEGHQVVSTDAIRYMLGGGIYQYNKELEDIVWNLFNISIALLSRKQLNIAVDAASCVSKKVRTPIIENLKSQGYEVTIMEIKGDKVQCIDRRMADNHGNVPREKWEEVWDKFVAMTDAPSEKEEATLLFTKPIYLVLQGPSVKILGDNIEKLKDKNVIWASLNRFTHLNERILSTIGKEVEVAYCSSQCRFREERASLINVMLDGLLITNMRCVTKYLAGILMRGNMYVSEWVKDGQPSLLAMLYALDELGAKEVFLFGADGGSEDINEVYFGQDVYTEDFKERQSTLYRDVRLMNGMKIDVGYKIFNVSNKTNYTCFETISYDEFFTSQGADQ